MPVLEQRFSAALLRRIRRRTAALSDSQESSHKVARKVNIREAQFSDFPNVTELGRRLGQGCDSLQNWKRLWQDNPAIQAGGAPARIGWVLESAGEILGFLGTIPLVYGYEGKNLIAAATCRFVVDPSCRASGHVLMTAFVRQKDVELLINTTATPSAGKIMTALKASQLPQADYGTVLFWVLDGRRFARTVLRKAGISPAFSALGSGLGAMAIRTETFLHGRVPKRRQKRFVVIERELEELPHDFDQFCDQTLGNNSRLVCRRTSAVMRWHFCPPENTRTSKALLCYVTDKLVGYAIVRHEVDPKANLRRSLIADLVAHGDDNGIVEALIVAAYQNAKRAKTHVLEMMGFPAGIRKAAAKWSPYARKYPGCPFFFKARDRSLHEKLSHEHAWYASPFDGDSTLWP